MDIFLIFLYPMEPPNDFLTVDDALENLDVNNEYIINVYPDYDPQTGRPQLTLFTENPEICFGGNLTIQSRLADGNSAVDYVAFCADEQMWPGYYGLRIDYQTNAPEIGKIPRSR